MRPPTGGRHNNLLLPPLARDSTARSRQVGAINTTRINVWCVQNDNGEMNERVHCVYGSPSRPLSYTTHVQLIRSSNDHRQLVLCSLFVIQLSRFSCRRENAPRSALGLFRKKGIKTRPNAKLQILPNYTLGLNCFCFLSSSPSPSSSWDFYSTPITIRPYRCMPQTQMALLWTQCRSHTFYSFAVRQNILLDISGSDRQFTGKMLR